MTETAGQGDVGAGYCRVSVSKVYLIKVARTLPAFLSLFTSLFAFFPTVTTILSALASMTRATKRPARRAAATSSPHFLGSALLTYLQTSLGFFITLLRLFITRVLLGPSVLQASLSPLSLSYPPASFLVEVSCVGGNQGSDRSAWRMCGVSFW